MECQTARSRLLSQLRNAVQREFDFPEEPVFKIQMPRMQEHGDYTTDAAFVLSPHLKMPATELSTRLASVMEAVPTVLKAVPADPGFVNLFLDKHYFADALAEILEQENSAGDEIHLAIADVVGVGETLELIRRILKRSDCVQTLNPEDYVVLDAPEEMHLILLLLEREVETRDWRKYLGALEQAFNAFLPPGRHSASVYIFDVLDQRKVIPRVNLVRATHQTMLYALKRLAA